MRAVGGLIGVRRHGQRSNYGVTKARARGTGAKTAICLAVLSLLAASCSSSPSKSSSGKVTGAVVVFAAASLKGAFDSIGTQFEKTHPGVTVRFNYAGSSSLATQLGHAAPADVFASADSRNMKKVTDGGLATGSSKVFAHNKLEIMVAAGNPKGVKKVADLASKNVKVAVCAPAVPCGAYTRQVFAKARVTVRPATEETSVSAVVTKVSLGEADAGIVYTTDIKAAGKNVAGVPIPADQNVTAEYPIVALKDAPNHSGATAFMDFVLSKKGQEVLSSYGFQPAGKQG